MQRDDWGRRAIETALRYAEHEWLADARNVLHGADPDGRMVDTPDISWRGKVLSCGWWRPGEVCTGVPYGWGNASTLEEFDRGIREGLYAGNVPEDKTRRFSRYCVGVDCSGLLTVCWGLPHKIATRDIPAIAEPLNGLEGIRQGDVFALPGSHVMLFRDFAGDGRVRIVDATRSTGRVSQREFDAAELFDQGYRVFRIRDDVQTI